MDNNESHYEHIEQLVQSYQNGSAEAGLELIQLFGYNPETKELSNFLGKYYNLLRYGVIKFRDRDTRRFIGMYIADPSIREGLALPYQYADVKKAARITIQRINDRMAFLEDDEIIHDLCSILLELASRYCKKGKKRNFCGYLYNSFKYYVFHNFTPLFQDLSYSNQIDWMNDFIDEDSEIALDDKWYLDLYFENESQELGLNWLSGKTSSHPFDKLTPFERTIISLHDDKGLTLEEVGQRMGYHRDTIWAKRKQIKQKLDIALKNPPAE